MEQSTLFGLPPAPPAPSREPATATVPVTYRVALRTRYEQIGHRWDGMGGVTAAEAVREVGRLTIDRYRITGSNGLSYHVENGRLVQSGRRFAA